MKLKAAMLTAIAVVVLSGTTTAQAHYIKPAMPVKQMTLQHQVNFWEYSANHYEYIYRHTNSARMRHAYSKAWKWALGNKVQAQRAYLASLLPPHYRQWLCIHHYEGAWNDPNAPYYGGLQFASSTWTRNGGLKYASNADQASPLEQMWIAENAWKESGGSFSQWPNTARYCGLL